MKRDVDADGAGMLTVNGNISAPIDSDNVQRAEMQSRHPGRRGRAGSDQGHELMRKIGVGYGMGRRIPIGVPYATPGVLAA